MSLQTRIKKIRETIQGKWFDRISIFAITTFGMASPALADEFVAVPVGVTATGVVLYVVVKVIGG